MHYTSTKGGALKNLLQAGLLSLGIAAAHPAAAFELGDVVGGVIQGLTRNQEGSTGDIMRALVPSLREVVESQIDPHRVDNPNADVVLYSTRTCPYCQQARQYLRQGGFNYVEYDTQTNAKGRQDYRALNGRGVPLILVGQELMEGFSEDRFRAFYARAKAKMEANNTARAIEQNSLPR